MISKNHLLMMAALELLAVALSVALYSSLPNPAPIHWDLHGRADQTGPPWEIAALVPVIGLVTIVLLVVLPWLGPFRENFERFPQTYGRIGVMLMGLCVALHIVLLFKAAGHAIQIGGAITLVLGLAFTILGNWMGKIRRNFYIGIRTPWTLSSEAVWERTHRAGAKVTVAIGLIWIVAGLYGRDVLCIAVIVAGAVFAIVWSFAYSLYWYRKLGGHEDLAAGTSHRP